MTVLKGEELARQTARLERLMAKAMSLAEEAGVPVGCVTKVGFNHRAHEMGITARRSTATRSASATTSLTAQTPSSLAHSPTSWCTPWRTVGATVWASTTGRASS